MQFHLKHTANSPFFFTFFRPLFADISQCLGSKQPPTTTSEPAQFLAQITAPLLPTSTPVDLSAPTCLRIAQELPSPISTSSRMDDGAAAWDLNVISEEDFDQLAVYQVQDKSTEEIEAVVKTSPTLSRAEASLPRNLILKPSQEKHTDVSSLKTFFQYKTFLAVLCR